MKFFLLFSAVMINSAFAQQFLKDENDHYYIPTPAQIKQEEESKEALRVGDLNHDGVVDQDDVALSKKIKVVKKSKVSAISEDSGSAIIPDGAAKAIREGKKLTAEETKSVETISNTMKAESGHEQLSGLQNQYQAKEMLKNGGIFYSGLGTTNGMARVILAKENKNPMDGLSVPGCSQSDDLKEVHCLDGRVYELKNGQNVGERSSGKDVNPVSKKDSRKPSSNGSSQK